MVNNLNNVQVFEMAEVESTHLVVNTVYNEAHDEVQVEPPISVVFEDEDNRVLVAVARDGLAARYEDFELRLIGDGNSVLGLNRLIGDIAMNGNLTEGSIKPLHPTLIEAQFIEVQAVESSTPRIKVQ